MTVDVERPTYFVSQESTDTLTPARTATIVALLGISYAFNGMDRQVFPALLPTISAQYGLSLWEGGLLSNIFAFNIALFGALSVWFTARFGRKAVLVGGLMFYSAFTFLTPFAFGFIDLATYRAMTGVGEALHIAAIFAMLGAYFGKSRGVYMGINNAFFGVGAFLGPVLGTHIFDATGSWRAPFLIYGIAGVISAMSILLFVPARFTEARDSEQMRSPHISSAGLSLFNWNSCCCILAFALLGCSFFAYASLYPTFLRTELNFTTVQAGMSFGMFGIGALSGFCLGWVGERMGKTGMIGALGLLAIVSYLMFNDAASITAQAALSLAFGALVSGYLFPRFFAVSQRCVAPDKINHITSILLPVFYLPGLLAGALFGKLVTSFGWHVAAMLAVTLPAVAALLITMVQDTSSMRGSSPIEH